MMIDPDAMKGVMKLATVGVVAIGVAVILLGAGAVAFFVWLLTHFLS
jgi:hypothetical protein